MNLHAAQMPELLRAKTLSWDGRLPKIPAPSIAPHAELPAPPAIAVPTMDVEDDRVGVHVRVARGTMIDVALDAAASRLNPDEDDLVHAAEFAIPSGVTRARARVLARRIVQHGMDRSAWRLLPPRFEAGSDGAVGLHWRTDRVELLIVIPPSPAEHIDYFGDTPSGAKIKGEIADQESVAFLAEWLVAHEPSA